MQVGLHALAARLRAYDDAGHEAPSGLVKGSVMDERRMSRRELLAGGLGLGLGTLAFGACSGASNRGVVGRAAATCPAGGDLGAIEHVVIVMQENRSFDHYFGTYRGVRGYGDRSGDAARIFAQAWPGGTSPNRTLLPYPLDDASSHPQCAGNSELPTHDWKPQHESWNGGRMDGWISTHVQPGNDGPDQGPFVMGYYQRKDIPFYHALADAFTICDAYHCSVMGPTIPNRMYLMSGMLDPAGTGGGPILETPGIAAAKAAVGSCSWSTMPEALSDKGVSWKIYQPAGTSVGPAESLALATGFNVMLYFKQFLADPTSSLYKQAFLPTWPDEFTADVRAGTLPAVSWMLPPIVESEHPNGPPNDGEWYVSQVLQTLVSNPAVWAKTLMLVLYDENGGFFDHVPPPTAPAGTPGEYLTATPRPADAGGVDGPIGLGFRVPALVVSPFSRGGWVSSDLFDHTSVLRFLEKRFDVKAPNISAWRRQTVGDLTSTLDLRSPDTSVPQLPATVLADPANGPNCPTPSNIVAFLGKAEPLKVPAVTTLPTQEPGTAKRRACAPAKA